MMKSVPLTRRRSYREYAITIGLFYAGYACWHIGQGNWLAVIVLLAGMIPFVDCWLFSRGVHELKWEGDHVTIASNGKVVFDGSFRQFKNVIGDQLGYDLYLETALVYRVKSANVSDGLREVLDAVCA